MAFLEARVKKKFPEFSVDVSLSSDEGGFVTLLGPSGSGKTTALMLLAGLLEPDSGFVRVGGQDVGLWPPEKRGFGVVFQDKLLFPHLSVFENVAFGLRVRGLPLEGAHEALEAVHLTPLAHRRVGNLSGGEQQRVALARAIAFRPRLLLLDEPLKELDAVVREKIKVELQRLQRSLGLTTVLVTHDVEEAFYFSDSVVLLNRGRVVQGGKPLSVFRGPRNAFVREFFSPYVLVNIGGKQALVKRSSLGR